MKYLIVSLFFSLTASAQVSKIKNFQLVETPTSSSATTPYLLLDGDDLWMSWQEPESKEVKVAKFATKWSAPVTAVKSEKLLLNWADFPSLQKDGQGHLYLNWLQSPEAEKAHGYFANISKSADRGKTWESLGKLHRGQNPHGEHGFVAMVSQEKGVRAFWLDGDTMKGHHDARQLRTAEVSDKVRNEQVVDDRTCSCCGTVTVNTPHGAMVFYRDRSDKEIRDISAAQWNGKKWQVQDVSRDGWEIRGCPVNGPNADSQGSNIAMVWYSGGGKAPGVRLTFSNDSGKSFSEGVALDDFLQGSLGRAQVLLLNAEEAVVFWMKSKAKDKADIYARRVHRDGRRGAPVIVAETQSGRGVGFPQAVKKKKEIFLVWAEEGIKMIRFASQQIPAVGKKDMKIARAGRSGLAKGEYVSQFVSRDILGKEVKLADFKGKNILLNFWASWCDACIEEFGMINELEEKYAGKNLKIIMVNVDDASDWEKAQKLIEQTKLSPAVWRSSAEQTTGQFGYTALPYTVLLDSKLMFRESYTGSLLTKREELEKQLSLILR